MSNLITITVNADTAAAAAKLQQFVGGMTEGFEKLTKAGDFLHGVMGKLAAAFTVEKIVEGVKHVVEFEVEIGRAAQRTGFMVETLSVLGKQGKLVGLEFESINMILGMFSQRIYMAATQGGQAAKGFRDLGIDITDATGRLRSNDAILLDVAQRFKELPDGAHKSGLAFDLFGRAGRQLIPLLNQGAEGMRKMKEEAEKAGTLITPEMVEKAEQFHRATVGLAGQMKKFFLVLTNEVLPALTDTTEALLKLTKQTDAAGASAVGFVNWMRGLIVFARALVETFNTFFAVLVLLGHELQILTFEIGEGVVAAFSKMGAVIKDVLKLLFDLVTIAPRVGLILAEAFLHPQKAMAMAKLMLAEYKADILKLGTDTGTVWSEWSKHAVKAWTQVKQAAAETFSGIKTEWAAWWQSALDLFDSKKRGPAGGPEASSPKSIPGSDLPLVSEEAKKLLAEVEKNYREVTESKLQLLDDERNKIKDKLRVEVKDQEDLYLALLQVDTIYNLKRRDLLDKESAARTEIAFAEIQAKRKGIENDPDRTEIEKKKELLPLLAKENELLLQQIQITQARVKDPALSDEAHIASEKELVKLEEKRVLLQQKIRDLQVSDSFFGNLKRNLIDLQNQFSNFGRNVANLFSNTIKNAVDATSNSIMGLIDGTTTWGQAFSNVARGIIADTIKIVVQWILSQTIIRGLQAIFKTERKTEAATEASESAPGALMASISSYGAAAAIGLAAVMAVLASVGAFAEGGLIGGGQKVIQVNERGPEYVVPAHMSALFPMLESIRTGAASMRNFSPSFRSPLTSGAGGKSALPGLAGGGGPQNINVAPSAAQFHVIAVHSREEMIRLVKENPAMRGAIIDLAKSKAMDFGVGT